MKRLRIVFMGTPEFAIPSLDMLYKEGYEIAAVVTQTDKPKGRGNKLVPTPVKQYAMERGIPVMQPEKVKTAEFAQWLGKLEPDALVTAAYGKILPKAVLDIPKHGCINVHGSLLPRYRGPAPIQRAVINGESRTGITTMYTDVGMDTGDMLLKEEVDIPRDMTSGELYEILSSVGAAVLKKTLEGIKDGTVKRIPQLDEEATYAPMITKETGLIAWDRSSREVHNLVRGVSPRPGAYSYYRGSRIRVWKSVTMEEKGVHGKPGEILKVDKRGMNVACGEGVLSILELQFDSGKRMSVEEYTRGHSLDEGEILG